MVVDNRLNIIVLGESGVGKTSLLLRFMKGTFRANPSKTTVDYHHKEINVSNKNCMLELWDTAGTDRFRSIVRQYFRKADGVLLIYDVTDITSFHRLSSWLNELREKNETAVTLIVGNKSEEPDLKTVSRSTVKAYAREEGMEYIEASAKSGENVNKIFELLTQKILEAQQVVAETPDPSQNSINNVDDDIHILCHTKQSNGIKAYNQDATDSTQTSCKTNVNSLPPIVPLSDDIIKLCVESNTTRGENDDSICCGLA